MPACSMTPYRSSISASVSPRSPARRIVCIAPRIPARGPFRSCATACSRVSFRSFCCRRSPVRTSSSARSSPIFAPCRSIDSFRAESSQTVSMKTHSQTTAFHDGIPASPSMMSAACAATAAIPAITTPASRPAFHVTSITGIRNRAARTISDPVKWSTMATTTTNATPSTRHRAGAMPPKNPSSGVSPARSGSGRRGPTEESVGRRKSYLEPGRPGGRPHGPASSPPRARLPQRTGTRGPGGRSGPSARR